MPSQIDFAVAVGVFLIFIVVLIVYLINYMTSYIGLTVTSELRTVAYNVYNSLFSSKGLPTNWESRSYTPVKVGLVNDLYRLPIKVIETNGTNRTGSIQKNITFDEYCQNKTWNNTVRVYYNLTQLPMKLYNQTFCNSQYLKFADVVFNTSFTAYQSKIFYIYYSPETDITGNESNVEFPINLANFTFITYPEEKLTALSPSKLNALRNLSYQQVIKTISGEYKFNLEIYK